MGLGALSVEAGNDPSIDLHPAEVRVFVFQKAPDFFTGSWGTALSCQFSVQAFNRVPSAESLLIDTRAGFLPMPFFSLAGLSNGCL